MKHSAIPWKTAIAFDHAYIRNIKDAQGEIIAQIPDWTDGLDEATANARLMAAAPDLLRALIGFQSAWEQNRLVTSDEAENIRAAIAKALGK